MMITILSVFSNTEGGRNKKPVYPASSGVRQKDGENPPGRGGQQVERPAAPQLHGGRTWECTLPGGCRLPRRGSQHDYQPRDADQSPGSATLLTPNGSQVLLRAILTRRVIQHGPPSATRPHDPFPDLITPSVCCVAYLPTQGNEGWPISQTDTQTSPGRRQAHGRAPVIVR